MNAVTNVVCFFETWGTVQISFLNVTSSDKPVKKHWFERAKIQPIYIMNIGFIIHCSWPNHYPIFVFETSQAVDCHKSKPSFRTFRSKTQVALVQFLQNHSYQNQLSSYWRTFIGLGIALCMHEEGSFVTYYINYTFVLSLQHTYNAN